MNRCIYSYGSVSTYSDLNNKLTDRCCNLDDASIYYDANSAIQGSSSTSMWNPSSNLSPKGNISSSMLGYINHVLMDDDLDLDLDLEDDKACPIQDATTLNAAEQSFYDVLHDHQPFWGQDTFCAQNSTSFETSTLTDINSYQSSHAWLLPHEEDYGMPEFHAGMLSSSDSFSPPAGLAEGGDQEVEGVLAKGNMNGLVNYEANGEALEVEINSYREKRVFSSPESFPMIRKALERGEWDGGVEDGRRRNKQLAADTSVPEVFVVNEMFDKVLNLWGGNNDYASMNEKGKEDALKTIYSRKGSSKREAVDTRGLLINCIQFIACNDQNNAAKLLKQIRLRSSLTGDGTQRLAHYFANALEARLANSGFPGYKDVVEKEKTFSDTSVLKALELFLSKFPFVVTSYLFASDMIMGVADKANTIHILHFGIVHGLQWFPFIERLSARAGGPPKLRITGIDIPQAGFRPAARIEETGRRLESYCKKFGVPFEYNAIAAKWENITVVGLKLKEDEVVIVNCLYQFMYLQDGTVSKESPRDAVLKLIRGIKPDIFIHGVLNGNFSSPFFASRAREALFHFLSFFNMYDAVVDRDNKERMVLERELLGKEILNVIACEGLERIERPEPYKQWETRTLRAGFAKVPLGKKTVEKLKSMVTSNYHKDFFIEVANQWVLQGWKGRQLFALSCWKPA